MPDYKKYAISDENGYYVDYTDDLQEANNIANEGTQALREAGEEFGQFAVLELIDPKFGFYEM